jgi:hypothetical protein
VSTIRFSATLFPLPTCVLTHLCSAGGYVLITNMIPLHALVLMLVGCFSRQLYVIYSWYAIGIPAHMQVPFVGFQSIRTIEHMAWASLASCRLWRSFSLFNLMHDALSKQSQTLLPYAAVAISLLGTSAIALLTGLLHGLGGSILSGTQVMLRSLHSFLS